MRQRPETTPSQQQEYATEDEAAAEGDGQSVADIVGVRGQVVG